MGKRKPKKAEPTPVGDLLTPAQRAVVNHTTGPLLAGAVAGAGKSTTLIERVAALYQHGTPLNRICLVAFNVSAAEDLNRKLKKRLKNVDTGEEDKEVARTLHSLALQIFKSEEQNRYMKLDTSGSLWSKAIREAHKSLGYGFTDVDTVKAFASKVRNDYIACDPTLARLGHFDADLLAAAEMTLRKKREPMFGSAEDVVRVFLEADRIRYSGEVSSGDGAFIDFDALVWEATRMLERDDGLRTVWQRRFDFILVDEAQDLCEAQWRMVEMLAEQHHNIVVVGDPAQCVAAGTTVQTPDGPVAVEHLKDNATIQSLHNRNNRYATVTRVWPTGAKKCVTITTDSGRQLTMSLDHRLWATVPTLRQPGELMIYMMYRRDLGFRVGFTNRSIDTKDNKWGARLNHEGGERLWILGYAANREDARLEETTVSLRYGIPTTLFNAEYRGLNQERANAVFARFGQNGHALLRDRGLSFDHPHWWASSFSAMGKRRLLIRLVAHSKKGSEVMLEWSSNVQFDTDGLSVRPRTQRKPGGSKKSLVVPGSRIRKYCRTLAEAEAYAALVAARSGAAISCSLSDSGPARNMMLYTASALHVGMSVATVSGNGFASERIASIAATTAECYDLQIDETRCFYANGVLTHNCLYRFRGARPERLLDFMNRWPGAHGSYMEHNFRSGSDILVAGNIVLDRMDASQKLPMHLVCTRDEKGFVGVIVEKEARDEAAAIMRACHAQKTAGREWRDMAILVRLNAQTKDIELQAFKAEVPIRMVSGSSFFTLPEAKAMLGYFRVLLGQADEDDLFVAISNPSRYLGRAFVEQVKRAVPNPDQPSDWLEAIPNSSGWRDQRAQQFVLQMREWRSSMKRGATPAQLLERILETTHYAEWHMRERADVDSANNANSFSATLERIREFMADFESVEQMLTTVDKMRAAQRSAAQSRNAVTVSTVHMAKGLEWGVVFVPGLVAQVWPTPWGQIDDELRCFYVAVTRARDILWLSRYEIGNPLEPKDSLPSPFMQMLLPGANTQTKPEADVQVASGQMTLL